VSDDKIQKRLSSSVKERGQYFLAFGVIASMLAVAGFPVFVIFFFGIFAYFLWKVFSAGPRNETREIFEFYLTANDILRDDERRWYGFEIKESIVRGERLLTEMKGAPPLVHFALGALYNKIGDHSAAVNHLSYVVENEKADERAFIYPSPELRNYVRVLRKIERDPTEAPLTSSAVRALERARKNRASVMLGNSRQVLAAAPPPEEKVVEAIPLPQPAPNDRPLSVTVDEPEQSSNGRDIADNRTTNNGKPPARRTPDKQNADPFSNRKPISEVLHDIYDGNIQ
jgi:hypothetical protein